MIEHSPNCVAERSTLGVKHWILVFLLLVSDGHGLLRAAEFIVGAKTNAVLRLGFSSSVFANVNENDAKAAMKLWTQAILQEHGIAIPADPQVLNGGEAIVRAVRDGLVDAVTITAEEYWALGAPLISTNAILGVSDGLVTEEYVLLVRKDSGFGRIDDLRGRRQAFCRSGRGSLGPVWFETLMLQSGLGEIHEFCGRVAPEAKLSQAVLQVFFHQADACVVTRRGFQTMAELNPQVGEQLKILASSLPMVPVVFVFRASYSDPAKDRIIAEIENVHSTLAGQQVFTLFQCDGLVVRPVSALDSAMDLLATHARLLHLKNPSKTAGLAVPIATVKAER
jgi:phosphonate transport system substrate-binding protein